LDLEHSGDNGHRSDVPTTASFAPQDGSGPMDDEGTGSAASPQAASMGALIDRAVASLHALSLEFPQAAKSARGPGRWLRTLTGVDESLLNRVWEERARYTGLGAIVLGTAIMATFSMLDALDQTFGSTWPLPLGVALFWGAFVCAIDRWLISSTHGVRASRWRIFLPRIALAILFGIIIATPLILTVFGSEVVSRAQNDQLNAVSIYEARLKACNPLPTQTGQPVAAPANCGSAFLSVADPAIGMTQTIGLEQGQAQGLAQTIQKDNQTITALNLTAREECNGIRGQGLSGIVGQGPNCNRDRRQADAFASQSHVAQLQTQLTALDQKLAQQNTAIGVETQSYTTAITNAIAGKVAAKQADEGRIGLLNRIDALGELASSNAAIAGATVLLGLFIVLVDCLPVLAKMMSGTTRYDKLVEERLRTAEGIAMAGLKVSERQATGRDEIALQAIESQVRAHLQKIDDASRFDRARRDAELDRKIAKLAAEFRDAAGQQAD
jgi:hypothetical protein